MGKPLCTTKGRTGTAGQGAVPSQEIFEDAGAACGTYYKQVEMQMQWSSNDYAIGVSAGTTRHETSSVDATTKGYQAGKFSGPRS